MDLSSKIILAALAAGLWVNVALTLRPTPAFAQSNALESIAEDLHNITMGVCVNRHICGL